MRERKGCKKRQENKRKKSFLEPKLSKIGFVNITAFPIPSQDPVPSPAPKPNPVASLPR